MLAPPLWSCQATTSAPLGRGSRKRQSGGPRTLFSGRGGRGGGGTPIMSVTQDRGAPPSTPSPNPNAPSSTPPLWPGAVAPPLGGAKAGGTSPRCPPSRPRPPAPLPCPPALLPRGHREGHGGTSPKTPGTGKSQRNVMNPGCVFTLTAHFSESGPKKTPTFDFLNSCESPSKSYG